MILEGPPSEIGSALPDSTWDGGDVILCVGEPAGFEPRERVARRFEYGSSLNLPRATSSIAAVLLGLARIGIGYRSVRAPRNLSRSEPGGQLVFATVGELAGLDLRQSLLAARIGFDEQEMPPVPVYSCSLRKTGSQAAGVPPRSRSAASLRSFEATQGQTVDPRLALIEDENARQMNLVRDRAAERQKVIDEEHAVVDRAVQRGFGRDGWIWVSESFADGYPGKFFLKGWGSPREWAIFSRDDKCILMLPHPEEPPSAPPSHGTPD